MNLHYIKTLVLLRFLSLPLLIMLPFASYANPVYLTFANSNNTAEADYIKGNVDKPAVLIMHGFLTTNKFHTITSISKSLQDHGYTTLAPNLTLGVNNRQTSIKCNSVHTHTLESDINEIDSWVNWLVRQGYKKIILIGHSSGSQELLEYLNTKPNTHIDLAIFTSLFFFKGQEFGTLDKDILYAQDLIKKNQQTLHKYNFFFFKNNYLATPKGYLSYLKLDRNYVLNSLKNMPMPTYTIMGTADKRYQNSGTTWLDELKKTPTHLYEVKGANHFFSREYEFDLQDIVIEILKKNHSQ